PGANVRHRQGYLAEAVPQAPADWTQEMWMNAFSNPLGSSAIGAAAQGRLTAEGELEFRLCIDPSPLHLVPDGEKMKAGLQVAIADRRPEGVGRSQVVTLSVSLTPQEWQNAKQTGLPYQSSWIPAPGVASVRLRV